MHRTTLSVGYGFPEGPSLGPDGKVYVAEISSRVIGRFGSSGERETFAVIDGAPVATAWGPDNALYVPNCGGLAFEDGRPRGASMPNSGGSIDRITRDGVKRRLFLSADEPLSSPNDLVFDTGEGFYFTDPGHGDYYTTPPTWPRDGRVFWASIDGTTIRKVASDYALPNGIAIKNDGETLLVCETLTSSVWAHDITGPGRIGPRWPYATLPADHRPDGCAVDSEDNLIVAAVGAGALVVFGPRGEFLDRIPTEDTDVTNVCFIGVDRATLVATEGLCGRVVAFDWLRPGMVPFPEHQR